MTRDEEKLVFRSLIYLMATANRIPQLNDENYYPMEEGSVEKETIDLLCEAIRKPP